MSEEPKTSKPKATKPTKRAKPTKRVKPVAKDTAKPSQNTPLNKDNKSEDRARVSQRATRREAPKPEAPKVAAQEAPKAEPAKRETTKAEPAKREGTKDPKRATKRVKPKRELPSFSWASIKAWWLGHPYALGALLASLFLIFMLYPPICSYYAAVRTNDALSEQLSDVTSERDDLANDVTKLTSEEGIKDEARRRGYVDEGDTAVDMEGIEDSGSAASDTTVLEQQNAEEEKETPWYLQALDFIFQYDPEKQGVS